MNSELQRIMQRRRQIAESEKRAGRHDTADESNSSDITPRHTYEEAEESLTNSPELDAIMRRRRSLQEGVLRKPEFSPSGRGGEDDDNSMRSPELDAIMKRRRKLADGGGGQIQAPPIASTSDQKPVDVSNGPPSQNSSEPAGTSASTGEREPRKGSKKQMSSHSDAATPSQAHKSTNDDIKLPGGERETNGRESDGDILPDRVLGDADGGVEEQNHTRNTGAEKEEFTLEEPLARRYRSRSSDRGETRRSHEPQSTSSRKMQDSIPIASPSRHDKRETVGESRSVDGSTPYRQKKKSVSRRKVASQDPPLRRKSSGGTATNEENPVIGPLSASTHHLRKRPPSSVARRRKSNDDANTFAVPESPLSPPSQNMAPPPSPKMMDQHTRTTMEESPVPRNNDGLLSLSDNLGSEEQEASPSPSQRQTMDMYSPMISKSCHSGRKKPSLGIGAHPSEHDPHTRKKLARSMEKTGNFSRRRKSGSGGQSAGSDGASVEDRPGVPLPANGRLRNSSRSLCSSGTEGETQGNSRRRPLHKQLEATPRSPQASVSSYGSGKVSKEGKGGGGSSGGGGDDSSAYSNEREWTFQNDEVPDYEREGRVSLPEAHDLNLRPRDPFLLDASNYRSRNPSVAGSHMSERSDDNRFREERGEESSVYSNDTSDTRVRQAQKALEEVISAVEAMKSPAESSPEDDVSEEEMESVTKAESRPSVEELKSNWEWNADSDFAQFGSFPTAFPDTDAGASNVFPLSHQPPPMFDAHLPATKEEQEWDTSPIDNPPTRTKARVSLVKKNLFAETFSAPPVVNPLSGSAIFCKSMKGEFSLHEIDLKRDCVQVISTPILTSELQRKVATKYGVSAHGVDSVIKISCGVHRSHGQVRLRVAAVVDLQVLDARRIRRVIVVWQWGYGTTQLVLLQSVLSPPSGSEFTYQPETLQIADSLVFLAGSSSKGPCVFICKPTVRETWSANFVGSTGNVSAMVTTTTLKRTSPYLAVALTNGNLSIWTYEAAISTVTSKKEAFRKLLFPLCQLEGFGAGGEEPKDVGYCTHLEWLPPQPSMSSLLMLAASFQGGLAVFHVALPVTLEDKAKNGSHRPLPAPTATTQLSQTVTLRPLVASRWKSQRQHTSVAWLDLGPHVNPCVVILLHRTNNDGEAARIALGAINVSLYGQSEDPKKKLVPFRILSSIEWPAESGSDPRGLLSISSLRSVVYYSSSGIVALFPSLSRSAGDAFFMGLQCPIASIPFGLDSSGDVVFPDTDSDKDGVLHFFTVLQCDRRQSDTKPEILEWSPPTRRHWLCRTLIGDCQDALPEGAETEDRGASQFGEEEIVTGGCVSSVVCELNGASLAGLVPCRIERCSGTHVCAVLFGLALGNPSDFSPDPLAVALIDTKSTNLKCNLEVIEGRDIAFVAKGKGSESVHALVLSRNGARLSIITRTVTSSQDNHNWATLAAYRPILGVEPNNDYIECRKIAVVKRKSELRLVVVATKVSDGTCCLLGGPLVDFTDVESMSWSRLLPNITKGPVLWLTENEGVTTLMPLPCGRKGNSNLVLATSKRLMIVSESLEVLVEAKAGTTAVSFSPLGSSCVGFFATESKVNYLSCIEKRFASGSIAALPTHKPGYCPYLLIAIRPDRLVYLNWHSGTRLVEEGQNPDSFLLPTASTRPALLLEPMVANALGEAGATDEAADLLRVTIERFGRKVASIAHGDDEGIGNRGSGITARVFEVLKHYGLDHPASWLLTGTVNFDRSANSKLLPPWLPVSAKTKASFGTDADMHLLANGDQYFSEYIKSPGESMSSTLPRPSDPSAYLSRDFAHAALKRNGSVDALKMMDMVGTEAADSILLHLSLALQVDPFVDVMDILNELSGFGDSRTMRSSTPPATSTSLAAVAVDMKTRKAHGGSQASTEDFSKRWMRHLAPSLQRGKRFGRTRQEILKVGAFERARGGQAPTLPRDKLWVSPCNESRHVWNEGPRKKKDHLLLLDRIEDWLGRRRPVVLGKEGASAARERGEKTLADILNMDDESVAEESQQSSEKGWAEGVGEGRSDEDNLSAYFRMSEGEDEDSQWRTEGLLDLSKYQNKALVIGPQDNVNLQPTSSSVDEGEPGKVKVLYDVVFEEAVASEPSGLAVSAIRGSSIDVGVLHGDDRETRQRCTLEFWYHLPLSDKVSGEIVLARRTMGPSGDDLSKVCLASDTECVLWELVVLQSGLLEFRTCTGAVVSSSSNRQEVDEDSDSDDDERAHVVSWEREGGIGGWNHVCLVFNSRGHNIITDCTVSLYMRGVKVASSAISVCPPGFENDEFEGVAVLDELLQKSHLVFGLNHPSNFRITELRVWSCERSEDDIKLMMREYLQPAETRKKFKVKIKNKRGLASPSKSGRGGLLAPPKDNVVGILSPPKDGGGLLSPRKDSAARTPEKGRTLPPPRAKAADSSRDISTPAVTNTTAEHFGESQSEKVSDIGVFDVASNIEPKQEKTDAGGAPVVSPPVNDNATQTHRRTKSKDIELFGNEGPEHVPHGPPMTPVPFDGGLPLSKFIRTSAAAAVVRGPPATRHFGGNRGGLPDIKFTDRVGVGAIAICGSEKTIVWRDNQDPPGVTYPIGASGAIVSDQMDEEGSEFLCCFLAKDKRMVVFELSTRTVIVELQMTTKLNFWRFLPPEAGEDTLCFMLITPVGGFHWMPLDESPRPRQVWKRGSDLQGKKIVSYEEGGSNGLEIPSILSRVGLILVTNSSTGGRLEGWVVPVLGDSHAVCASVDILGACLLKPPHVRSGPFLPYLVLAKQTDDSIALLVSEIIEPQEGSLAIEDVVAEAVLDESGFEDAPTYEPPTLAMGTWPEVLCCSIGCSIVAILRRKGLVLAFELTEDRLECVAREVMSRFVLDAVLRLTPEGFAELVLLLSDIDNPKDGRVVSMHIPT